VTEADLPELCPDVPSDYPMADRDRCGVPTIRDEKRHHCYKLPGHDDQVHVCWCRRVAWKGK
jgi:hypothetical protein